MRPNSGKTCVNLLLTSIIVAASVPLTKGASPGFWVGLVDTFDPSGGSLGKQLSVVKSTGVNSIRNEILWQTVETSRGRYAIPERYDNFVDQSLAFGIQPLVLLDYGNSLYDHGDKPLSDSAIAAYANYAEFVVKHFKGKAHLYEIWNEWSGPVGNTTKGTAESYTKLLKVVYPRIKAVDPTITVLGGAVSAQDLHAGWLIRMLDAGAVTSLDAISIHPYTFYRGDLDDRSPEAWQLFVAQTEADVRKYDQGRDFPLYVTEIGWPTHTGSHSSTPDREAAFLAQTFLLARTMSYVKGVWWYSFRDASWNAEHQEANFGIVRPDLKPKPAFYALSRLARFVAEKQLAEEDDIGDPTIRALNFKSPGGIEALAIWNEGTPGSQPQVEIKSEDEKAITVSRLYPADQAGAGANSPQKRLEIRILALPVIVEGKRLKATASPK
jgi:hypothetical protein